MCLSHRVRNSCLIDTALNLTPLNWCRHSEGELFNGLQCEMNSSSSFANFNPLNAGGVLANQCVQRRLACSMGVSPIRARVRSPVTWVAFVEETKRMKPIDKAINRMVSESPGHNISEPEGGLDKK